MKWSGGYQMEQAWNTEGLKAYREGCLVANLLVHWNCCVPRTSDEELFRYIELIYEDGSHKFIYSDQKGYERFLENFHENRFTSFHEFWTTEEPRVEQRGVLSLKYYARREKQDYIIAPLGETLEQLAPYPKLPERVTTLGRYDKTVNYHWQEESDKSQSMETNN
jgi:hypothetical protein